MTKYEIMSKWMDFQIELARMHLDYAKEMFDLSKELEKGSEEYWAVARLVRSHTEESKKIKSGVAEMITVMQQLKSENGIG